MIIVGINAYHGDVSAVLLREGQLVAAVEEERFRRVKHWAGFPREAIRACLDMAGVTPKEVDHIAISRNPKANLLRKALFTLKNRPSVSLVRDRVRNAGQVQDLAGVLSQELGVRREEIRTKLHWVEHHPAHLASSFFVSPFEEAAVCAIDGFGDFVSTSWAIGRGNKLEILERVYFPHSLGLIYLAVTQYLGFLKYGDEFKVMGLAPYGEPEYVDALRQLIHFKPGGRFEIDLSYFRHWSDGVSMTWDDGEPTMGQVYTPTLEQFLGPARKPEEPLTSRHEAIAASLQVVFEEAAFHVLNGLYEKTRLPRLCLAGGCAMNSVMNGKIRERTGWGLIRQEGVRGVAVLRAAGTRLPKTRFVGRATNYVSYFASAALAWARRWRVPFVFLCQDIFPEVARLLEDFRSPTIERVLERVNRLLVRRATRVVALGETMKERLVTLRGADPAKVAVIHNWADRAALGGGVRDSAFAREHGLVGRFIVMHAGNLGLSQGLEALVDAAARLVTDCPNLDVVFVGDGAKRGALESRARDVGARNVRFLPFLPRERMRESYGAADLFVISLKAGLAGFIVPSKLYSILAAGKSYVAAVEDESEVAAIALQYGCGLLAPPGDAGALAERIRTLYRDRPLLERLAANARTGLGGLRPARCRAGLPRVAQWPCGAIMKAEHLILALGRKVWVGGGGCVQAGQIICYKPGQLTCLLHKDSDQLTRDWL